MQVRTVRMEDRYGRQVDVPQPPVWFVDVVEKFAREWGRHAETRWEPRVGCFVSLFSRRASDPVLASVQSGQRADVGEPVYWHEHKPNVREHPLYPGRKYPGFVALDVEQMGESGVREYLDRNNLWSGRGEHVNLTAAIDAHVAANDKKANEKQQQLRDGLEDATKATIRHAHGLATVNVPDNITRKE